MPIHRRSFLSSFLVMSPATGILVAGLALMVFSFLPGTPHRLEQYDLPKELIVGAVGGLSALYLMARADSADLDSQAIALWGFGIWGAVLVALVAKNTAAGWRTLGMLGAVAAIFLLARRASRRFGPERVYWLTALLIFASCVIVLLEAYAAIPFISAPGRRPGGTFGNRNLAARIACLALPLIWNRLIATKRHTTHAGLFVVGACVVATIVISRSRATYLMALILVAGLPAFTAISRRVTWEPIARSKYLIWLTAAAVGAVCAVTVPNRMGWRAAEFRSSASRIAEHDNGTGRGRIIQAETSLRMIRRHPLVGVGPGNWSVLYPAYAHDGDPSVMAGAFFPGPQVPRNDILTLVAEWGLMGCVPLIVFLVALARKIYGMLIGPDEYLWNSGLVVLAVALSMLVLGTFDSVLRVASTAAIGALLSGAGLGAKFAPTMDAGIDDHVGFTSRSVVVFAAFAFASMLLARSAAQDIAAIRIISSPFSTRDLYRAVNAAPHNVEARALLSYVLVSGGRCDLAKPHLDQAARLQPMSLSIAGFEKQCQTADAGH